MQTGLSSSEIITLAKKMYKQGGLQPLMIHGPPGIGKTETVRKLANELFGNGKEIRKKKGGLEVIGSEENVYCIIISAPLLEPTDVKGLPVPDLENKIAYWIEPFFLPKKGPGIIFIDDLTAAPRSVVASLLMLIQHRRVLQYTLPDDVMIMTAGNRVEDNSYCDNLSAAMRSRMTHINLVPDFDEWVKWAVENEIHPSVISFLRWRKGSLYFSTSEEEMAELAFPCPRTWEHVSNLMKLDLPQKILRESVLGTIGVPAGNEFLIYTKMCNEKLPRVEDVLNDPENAPIPKNLDLLFSLMQSLAFQAKYDKYHKAIVKYAMRLADEYQVILMTDVLRTNMGIVANGDKLEDGTIDISGYVNEFFTKHRKIIECYAKNS